MTDDLYRLTALECVSRLRAGELTPLDLIDAVERRVEQVNGAVNALVFHAEIGFDEISPRGVTAVWEIRDGLVADWQLDPADVGLEVEDICDLAGGEPRDNASRIQRLLEGKGSAATPIERQASAWDASSYVRPTPL